MQAHNIPLPKGNWDLGDLDKWVPEENRDKLLLVPCAQCGTKPDLSLGQYKSNRCSRCMAVHYW